MIRYVRKRLITMIPIMVGVVLIMFVIMEITPGDPAARILGLDAGPEAIAALREELGLNKPFTVRFVTYITNIVTKLDFGESYRTGNPVFEDIVARIPVSFKVAMLSMIVSLLFGIPLGVYSAVKQYSLGDNVMRVLATVLVAMPTFWFAMLLVLGFALYLRLLPSGGVESWKSYILPVVTIGGPSVCGTLRMTRTTMLEEIRKDYVRTARAKGVPDRVVTYRHALKNALLPVITSAGNKFGALLGGSVVVETVFALPGLGSLVVLSIKAKDTPVVIASVLLIAIFYAFVTLGVDLIYAFLDPRVKAKYSKSN